MTTKAKEWSLMGCLEKMNFDQSDNIEEDARVCMKAALDLISTSKGVHMNVKLKAARLVKTIVDTLQRQEYLTKIQLIRSQVLNRRTAVTYSLSAGSQALKRMHNELEREDEEKTESKRSRAQDDVDPELDQKARTLDPPMVDHPRVDDPTVNDGNPEGSSNDGMVAVPAGKMIGTIDEMHTLRFTSGVWVHEKMEAAGDKVCNKYKVLCDRTLPEIFSREERQELSREVAAHIAGHSVVWSNGILEEDLGQSGNPGQNQGQNEEDAQSKLYSEADDSFRLKWICDVLQHYLEMFSVMDKIEPNMSEGTSIVRHWSNMIDPLFRWRRDGDIEWGELSLRTASTFNNAGSKAGTRARMGKKMDATVHSNMTRREDSLETLLIEVSGPTCKVDYRHRQEDFESLLKNSRLCLDRCIEGFVQDDFEVDEKLQRIRSLRTHTVQVYGFDMHINITGLLYHHLYLSTTVERCTLPQNVEQLHELEPTMLALLRLEASNTEVLGLLSSPGEIDDIGNSTYLRAMDLKPEATTVPMLKKSNFGDRRSRESDGLQPLQNHVVVTPKKPQLLG
ncbi:hypothetical protein HK104_006506 [Borealophlyctis nickersoniae]|nr:hypothetical protein HK104_006506 [Borealophlyctis nickersoniae]